MLEPGVSNIPYTLYKYIQWLYYAVGGHLFLFFSAMLWLHLSLSCGAKLQINFAV